MRKYLYILVFCAFSIIEAKAQDPQFTQFYAAPLYHNPAFAGSAFRGRFIANYRNQWPALPRAFVTYSSSYDNFSKKYNSGYGLIVTSDKAGTGALRSTSATANYAYQIQLSREWIMRAGLSFGLHTRNIDYFRLTFGDQLNEEGVTRLTDDPSQFNDRRINYFDASSGMLLYSRYFWFGVSALHMNQPNQSVIETMPARLPMRINIMTGMVIPLEKKLYKNRYNARDVEKSITPSLLYKFQGKFDQLDLGAYFNYNSFVLGLWYRGIPVFKNYEPSMHNHDAIAFLVGFKQNEFGVGYSYDITVSRLGPRTSGAHEISLVYEFSSRGKAKKRPKAIPCPSF